MASPSVRLSLARWFPVALVLFGVLGCLLYSGGLRWVGDHMSQSFQSSDVASNPSIVNDWPTSLPEESRRVHAFEKFSFVAPRGWIASVSEDAIEIEAPGEATQRSSFMICKVHDPYKHQRPLPQTNRFQEGRACVRILHFGSLSMEPIRHEAQVIVERGGEQFEINFYTYNYFSGQIPDPIWAFLETFEEPRDSEDRQQPDLSIINSDLET